MVTAPLPADVTPDPAQTVASAPDTGALPIVAIGASAGGLEALSKLFQGMPANTGMAFIVVQHLDPTHKSMMADLLGEHTVMPVEEVADGRRLEPDHVYVIAPGSYLSVRAGALSVTVPDPKRGARMPFDVLLRSLAQTCGPQTIAAVLTGTGTDGSDGVVALKLAGGRALAQSPAEAEFSGMPQSAIDTGHIDKVLTLQDLPAELAAFTPQPSLPGPDAPGDLPAPDQAAGLAAILDHLFDTTGHDFRAYKPGTITRRIARRMGLLAISLHNLGDYLGRLRADPGECALLVNDLLINVTRFFRDPEVFEGLETAILPDLVAALPPGQALRVWVAGCSTGEEAYSIAMICNEAIRATHRDIKLQVFASDIDPDAIATAREGLYPADIVDQVSPARLARHFVAEEMGYRVLPVLRGQVVFSVQDVLTDPPFSRLNLITCRNLLIYLNTAAQAKVIALFHFALRAGGTLVLGSAETVGQGEGRFEPVPGVECCYRHVAHSRLGEAGFPFSFDDKLPLLAGAPRSAPPVRQASLADLCSRAVLARHAPAAVLINRKFEWLFSVGPTNRFLQVAPGYASLNLLDMVTPALRTRLRHAVNRATRANPIVDGGSASIKLDGATIRFGIDVECLIEAGEDLLLVCFVDHADTASATPGPAQAGDATRLAELERELAETQTELQTSIHERDLANQEQKAINEEALSVNEEFQSANEELLTSKEELQSLNEELTALNSQLQETLERQRLASDDLQNVLYSTNVGTMFLDTALQIRFFTPAIKPLFNVIGSDIGRPLADLRPIADDPGLLADARAVLADGATIECEVRAPGDTWFSRRIFPYRAHDSQVKGVVITFADITERKRTTVALENAKLESERANAAKSRFLAAASHDLRQPLQVLTLLKDRIALVVTEDRAQNLFARFDQTLHALSTMLDTLLNINQIEAGAVHPRRAVFAIAQMLDRLRQEFTPLAQERGLTLDILPCPALVETDPQLLEQMLRNLLNNAVKYTQAGRIMLACRHRGTNLRIKVYDTGIGIAEGQLHAIFEEFHQVENPERDRSRGLGLGLAIVHRLGRLLGHAVTVTSVPGKGSTFAITVPCHTDAETDTAAAAAPAMPAPALVSQTDHRSAIVVVEDDPDLLDLLVQLLRTHGHTISAARDAASATELIAHGAIRPDLLLTDYNLPGGATGVNLLAAIRTTLGRDLPAIVLTGDISTEAIAAITGAGGLQLCKPVAAQALILAIEQLCPPPGAVAAIDTAAREQTDMAAAIARTAGLVTFVIDDEPLVLASICDLLQAHGQTVADFATAESFLAAYHPGAAACLLVDAHLPGMSGIDLMKTLRARGDHVPVIMITGDGDIGLAVEAMRAGASEFIEKPVGQHDLLLGIARATARSQDLRVVDQAHADAARRIADLTERQKQVLDLVLAGHPSKNIAADLGISQRTVENHRAEVMHRMGVKSIPELARKVLLGDT
ncbi:chemotaxis protein CheB [Novosphingobium sp.]|uniref:chemotaxis protein CheB n=1 Tax=Novosphingobium sp. TaxID=1874826 RepID=UPI003342B00F